MNAISKKAVVLEDCGILCGLGELEETVTDLFEGASAIVPGPCFDVATAYAPLRIWPGATWNRRHKTWPRV